MAVVLGASPGCAHHKLPKKPVADQSEPAVVGESAPDFALPSVDGGLTRLSSYSDKVVIVAFWATFCRPCRDELPQLGDLLNQQPGVVVLTISVDDAESDGLVRNTVSRMHLHLPVLRDPEGRVVYQYSEFMAIPMTLLIGRDGKLRARHYGYSPALAERLRQEVSAALNARPIALEAVSRRPQGNERDAQ